MKKYFEFIRSIAASFNNRIIIWVMIMISLVFAQKEIAYSQPPVCCNTFVVTLDTLSDCCIQVNVENTHYDSTCHGALVFQYLNPITMQYETRKVDTTQPYTVSAIICPEYGEEILTFRFRIAQKNDHNQPYCTGWPPWEFREEYTEWNFTYDASECCHCPESEYDSWLETILVPSHECGGGCKVIHKLNIPENIKCFKYYFYDNIPLDIFSNDIPRDMLGQPISEFDRCIPFGQSSEAVVFLLRHPDDMNPCILRASASCDSNSKTPDTGLPDPCDQSCNEKPWQYFDLSIPLSSCPGCSVKVHYAARTNCDSLQQLEILRIEYLNPNVCFYCANETAIMQEALTHIIAKNDMKFEPGESQSGCDTTWQIGNGSCWATIPSYYFKKPIIYNPMDPIAGFTLDSIMVKEKCDSVDCCFQKFRVCKSGNFYSIWPLETNNTPALCGYKIKTDPLGSLFPCEPHCEWLQFDTLIYWPTGIPNKNVISNHKKTQNFNYFYVNNNTLYFENLKKLQSAQLTIYDLLGNRIMNFNLINNNISNEIDLNILSNGVYFIILSNEECILQTDKFLKSN